MRILVIGKFNPDSFGTHIADTLKDMGNEIIKYEIGVAYKRNRNKFLSQFEKLRIHTYDLYKNTNKGQIKELKRIFKNVELKVELIVVTYDFFYPEQVKLIRKHFACPIILWFPDSILNLGKSLFVKSPYDFVFFKDPYIVQVLREDYNCDNVYFLPQCLNPKLHNIFSATEMEKEFFGSDITTAGNLHTYRVKLFEQLTDYEIKLWGNPPPLWLNTSRLNQFIQNKYVTGREKSIVFHYSKIVLNNQHPTEYWGVNIRTFEIAGAGGFQITNNKPGLEQLFLSGNEIETYNNIGELREKLNYYLENENQRKKVSEAAYKRAQSEHTYMHRLTVMLETVNGKRKGYEMPAITYTIK